MMLPLTNLFYEEIIHLSDNKLIPCRLMSIIYDQRWTPQWIINDIKNNLYNKSIDEYIGDSCYYYIIEELDSFVNNSNESIYICDSCDLGDENTVYGDYLFHIGKINKSTPFLYMESSHMYAYPSRLILYGERYQIEVSEDKVAIDVYDVNPLIRNKYMISNKKERILSVMDILQHSDRPRIDI